MFPNVFNVYAFFLGLCFGLVAVYVKNEEKRKIFVHPNPENVRNLQFKDKAGACFKLVPQEKKCGTTSWISKIIPQT